MKRSMELEIEINKLRQTALDDDATAETIAEIRSAVDLATQKRTVALEIEGAEQTAAEAVVAAQATAEGHQDVETAEQREFVRVGEQAEIRDFLQAFSRHEQIDRVQGAAAEFRAAIYGQDIGSEWMPLPNDVDSRGTRGDHAYRHSGKPKRDRRADIRARRRGFSRRGAAHGFRLGRRPIRIWRRALLRAL